MLIDGLADFPAVTLHLGKQAGGLHGMIQRSGGIPRLCGLNHAHTVHPGFPQGFELDEPRLHLCNESGIIRLGPNRGRSLGYLRELGLQAIKRLASRHPGPAAAQLQHLLHHGGNLYGLLFAVIVPAGPPVAIMIGKRLHGGGAAGEQNTDTVLPCPVGIIGLGVPSHVRHAEQGNLGSLRLIHRIGSKPLHKRHRVRIHAIGAPQKQGMAHVIRHREIPPDKRRTLQILINPLQSRSPDIAHNAGTGPHDAYILVQMFPHYLMVAATTAGIRRGAYDQRRHIRFFVDKLLIQVIQKLHLALRFGPLSADVVKKYGKGTESQIIHHLKLLHGRLPVRLAPVNIRSGMHGPDKIHLILLRPSLALSGPSPYLRDKARASAWKNRGTRHPSGRRCKYSSYTSRKI